MNIFHHLQTTLKLVEKISLRLLLAFLVQHFTFSTSIGMMNYHLCYDEQHTDSRKSSVTWAKATSHVMKIYRIDRKKYKNTSRLTKNAIKIYYIRFL